jgi:AraC family transcriptional regulator, regulatory protein of adaptative response / methylated-DNA-[protein]-cysteine methyltransferase
MLSEQTKQKYFQALLDKNPDFEGVFYVGVKTTGVFCRPTCPARKPLFENCEFFTSVQDALLASFRPCKRCQPLSYPGSASDLIQRLIESVEENPEKRWKDADFHKLGIDTSTVRRQFKKRFGMTFVAYARSMRMGIAMKEIRLGGSVIDAQITTGFESGSGFRDAFSKILGEAPVNSKNTLVLKAHWIDTKLGPMLAIGDDDKLYLLEFVMRRGMEREIEKMRKKLRCAIVPGKTRSIESIEKELTLYFDGKLKEFKTPIRVLGTAFQRKVWEELQNIPYGETRSYADVATALGKPTAYRAVANANGCNQLAIIIPCHRVINTGGAIGGYGGGLEKKKWMLNLERGE